MKIFRMFAICASAVLVTSCTRHLVPFVSVVRFSQPIKEPFSLTTNNAVVYGRFATDPDFAFGNKLTLRLRNENSKQVYFIQCRDKDPVYAVAVEPGSYRVTGILATFQDHRPCGRRNFPAAAAFEVRSNCLTYLGDFAGYARIEAMTQIWGISGITNDFETTTEALQKAYPNLATNQVFSVFDDNRK